jgi:hypothetical protein
MKSLALAMWITVSAMAGCAVESPDASEPAASDTAATEEAPSTATEAPSIENLLPPKPAAFSCSAKNAACLSAFQCHHQEGTNIGTAGCPSGTTCCVF